MTKIEKLEKLLAEATGKPDSSLEVIEYSEALRNSASAMIEIVKAAKRVDKEVDKWIASAGEGETRHPAPELVDLKKILQKFEEST